MSKRFVIIAVTLLSLLSSGTSMAKVCRLGDTSCDTNGYYGIDSGGCDASFKTCDNPRLGATYCFEEGETKYKDNDCCSWLVANEGYQNCSIDEALVGYGKSCKGAADNITYWQYCGCSYGFVEVDESNTAKTDILYDELNNEIINVDGNPVPYEARCGWSGEIFGGKCRFAQCNTERRFFLGGNENYCKYREATRCGGFGCVQVYDCNHDELNTGKEYYRNDSEELSTGVNNFIPYMTEDQLSNERDINGTVKLIRELNATGMGLTTEDYNLTNKIVCSYAQSDGTGDDKGTGLNCGSVPNYCYLWTGCNTIRKWYNNHVNEGVIYDSEEAYLKWMNIVENQEGYNYNADYVKNNPYHDAFYAEINPGYGTYTKSGNDIDAVNQSSCIKGIGCRITSANNGCTYITTNCHQNDAQHQCWKKISCSEENRFYSSFINAANIDSKTGKPELYLSSLNSPYWDEFYTGLSDKEIYPACLYEINECNDASGCYRKIGCEASFEDVRDHEDLENDWFPWFGEVRALCNDSTRCYKATSCEASVGSYSSSPNTSFFITISSTATGLTCYRGQECNIESGSYSSTPNTSFFATVSSLATGSICYRGQNCNEVGGAYSSSPNTFFFFVDSSSASGSTCYRGSGCKDLDNGAYSSSPNTSFFYTISSFASGSGCYRGSSCNIEAGAYSSSPNTSFFVTISSSATGSTSYRGESSHIAAGAYSSAPNTSFFYVIKSQASGSTSYRGESSHIAAGAYSSAPNTSFFYVIKSQASGSTSYRGQESHIAAGAYSSTPNTSFFYVISSQASGSTSYRGQESHIAAGAYSSAPNTSFFYVIKSQASGSISYRGQESHIAAGAYSSSPNTMFFVVISSQASGSISYRGESATIGAYTSAPNTSFFYTGMSLASGSTSYRATGANEEAGAYNVSPNTSFFHVIKSVSSGLTSYRADRAHKEVGAYSSAPNTSFFYVISSQASGSTSYRAQESHIVAGAYSSTPNTSFFITINSSASGSISYRGESVNKEAGAYTSKPSTTYFEVHTSSASGSVCYRGAKCAITSSVTPNDEFFLTTKSIASGSTCYRSSGCNTSIGVYTSAPNSSFFNILSSSLAQKDSTCYRGGSCATTRGAYSSIPNTSFFEVSSSVASGSVCYRGEGCRACASTTPANSSFFNIISSSASEITCYRGEGCATTRGAYTSAPNTTYFITASSSNCGSTCYRGINCNLALGSYNSTPNTSFFKTSMSSASGLACYRGAGCNTKAGAYTTAPNSEFFNTVKSTATGETCYRADGCGNCSTATPADTSYFANRVSVSSGITCYRGDSCAISNGAYVARPNTQYFKTSSKSNCNTTCYRGIGCNTEVGAYSSVPNTAFFGTTSSKASGLTCYRANGCSGCATASAVDSSYFVSRRSAASGITCYRGDSCAIANGAYAARPNTQFFNTASKSQCTTCYRGTGCNTKEGAYENTLNTNFFSTIRSSASGYTCYRANGCGSCATSVELNSSFFNITSSKASGYTCYRGDSCATSKGAYASWINTSFFTTVSSSSCGNTCYRGTGCNTSAGAFTDPNIVNTTYFNIASSQASGITCYRRDGCKANPNRCVFTTSGWTEAGQTCYIPNGCKDRLSSINTQYFYTSSMTSFSMSCQYATSAKCSATDTNTFTYASSSTDVTEDCETITAYKPIGCNTSQGYTSSPYPNNKPSYFVPGQYNTTSTSGCGNSVTCYAAGPNACVYDLCNSSFFSQSSETWDPNGINKTCYGKPKCKEGCSSPENTSYFKSSSLATCYANNRYESVSCYKTTSCVRGEVTDSCKAVYSDRQVFKYTSTTSTCGGSECLTERPVKGDNCFLQYDETEVGERRYYVWGGSYTCGINQYELKLYYPTACNESVKSYSGYYGNEDITLYYSQNGKYHHTLFGKYSDAFVEHMVQSYKGGCSDIAPSCYVGCSCAEGWTAGSARQNSDGSWTTSFANENNGDNIWAIDRRHNGGAYNSTQLACYKAGCESGYYVERPSSSIFIEKQSSTEKHGLPCFKAVGCKAGFTTEKIDGAESYTYHGFTCYKQEECSDGYFDDKPDDKYFTYETKGSCYKVTGCKTGYSPNPDPYGNCPYNGDDKSIDSSIRDQSYHGFNCYFSDYKRMVFTAVYYLYPDRTEYNYKTVCDDLSGLMTIYDYGSSPSKVYNADCNISTPQRLKEYNGTSSVNKPDGGTSDYELFSSYSIDNGNVYINHNVNINYYHCAYEKAYGKLYRGIIASETVNKSNNYCNGQTNSFIALVPKVYDDTNKSQLKFILNCNYMPSSVKFNVRYSYTYNLYDTAGIVRETKDVTTSRELSCKDSGKSITIPTEITSASAAQGRLFGVEIDTVGTSMDHEGSGCGFDRCGCTTISGTKYGVAIEDTSYE